MTARTFIADFLRLVCAPLRFARAVLIGVMAGVYFGGLAIWYLWKQGR